MSMPDRKSKATESSVYAPLGALLKHFHWIGLAMLAGLLGAAVVNFVLAQP